APADDQALVEGAVEEGQELRPAGERPEGALGVDVEVEAGRDRPLQVAQGSRLVARPRPLAGEAEEQLSVIGRAAQSGFELLDLLARLLCLMSLGAEHGPEGQERQERAAGPHHREPRPGSRPRGPCVECLTSRSGQASAAGPACTRLGGIYDPGIDSSSGPASGGATMRYRRFVLGAIALVAVNASAQQPSGDAK